MSHDSDIGNFTGNVNGEITGGGQSLNRQNYRMGLQAILNRIEERLAAVGMTAAAASRAAGLSEDAIRNLRRAVEKGGREHGGISTRTISALAIPLKTTEVWLMGGDKDFSPLSVPVVGFVQAGAEAVFFAAGQGPFDYVPAPDGSSEKTVAVEIRGESLGPFFSDWLVFYDNVQSPVTPDLHGQLCVVGLPDGRVLVKKLKASREEGLFHLMSQTEGPLLDQEIDWAARVKAMTPR